MSNVPDLDVSFIAHGPYKENINLVYALIELNELDISNELMPDQRRLKTTLRIPEKIPLRIFKKTLNEKFSPPESIWLSRDALEFLHSEIGYVFYIGNKPPFIDTGSRQISLSRPGIVIIHVLKFEESVFYVYYVPAPINTSKGIIKRNRADVKKILLAQNT